MRVLTCVTYHHFDAAPDEMTSALGVTTHPATFRRHLEHYRRYYTPVGLDRVLSGDLPPRALLVTIDDAYRSVLEVAAPILREMSIPAVFFTNPLVVGGDYLPIDNLVSLASSRLTHAQLVELFRKAAGTEVSANNGADLARLVLPMIGTLGRDRLRVDLANALGIEPADVARRSGLFLSRSDLARLPAEFDIEIGNHTRSHVYCRTLTTEEYPEELTRAKDEIESITDRPVRAFSFPYGSRDDATPAVTDHLRQIGHRAFFLVMGRANTVRPAPDFWYRTSMQDNAAWHLPGRLQILPHLRTLKAALK